MAENVQDGRFAYAKLTAWRIIRSTVKHDFLSGSGRSHTIKDITFIHDNHMRLFGQRNLQFLRKTIMNGLCMASHMARQLLSGRVEIKYEVLRGDHLPIQTGLRHKCGGSQGGR